MAKDEEELHLLQRAFRGVLDAFARPGTVHRIEPMPPSAARPAEMSGHLETLVRMLVDQAVTFCVVGGASDAAAAYLVEETHARRRGATDADYVIVPFCAGAGDLGEAIWKARPGTLASPETGATVLAECSCLAACPSGEGRDDCSSASGEPASDADLYMVEVSGPGVDGASRFLVDRASWVPARAARHDEFPCGIEIVLVDAEGRVVVLPRSAEVGVVASSSGTAAREVR